jgi:hypothetical protein
LILFFFKKLNSIDHMTPVVYRMAKDGYGESIRLFSNDYKTAYRDDYRYKFLKRQFDLDVDYTIAQPWGGIRRLVYRTMVLSQVKRQNPGIQQQHADNLVKKLPAAIWNKTARLVCGTDGYERLYHTEWCKEFLRRQQATALVFDVSAGAKKHSRNLIQAAALLNIPTIAIPNACNITTEDVQYRQKATLEGMKKFDRIVVHRDAFKKHLIGCGLDPDKISVIGSARFCREWNQVLEGIQMSGYKHPRDGKDRLKVLVIISFTPLDHVPSNFYVETTPEEIRKNQMEMLRLLGGLDFINLVIKTHPSYGKPEHLPQEIFKYAEVPGPQVDTYVLCRWADVVVSTSSSAVLNAFCLNKTVVHPRGIDGFPMIFDQMGSCIAVDNNKELTQVFASLYKRGAQSPYPQENVARFLDHVTAAGIPGKDVLGGYVDFILSVASSEQAHGQGRSTL